MAVVILEDNESEEVGLMKSKWWLASLFSEGINRFKDCWMLNQLLFQTMLAGKINKKNPEQHCEEALPRQEQHRYPG